MEPGLGFIATPLARTQAGQGGLEVTENSPKMRTSRKSTKKTTNRTLAIFEEINANLEKPKIPAMAASRKKNRAIKSDQSETKTTSFLPRPGLSRRGRTPRPRGSAWTYFTEARVMCHKLTLIYKLWPPCLSATGTDFFGDFSTRHLSQ